LLGVEGGGIWVCPASFTTAIVALNVADRAAVVSGGSVNAVVAANVAAVVPAIVAGACAFAAAAPSAVPGIAAASFAAVSFVAAAAIAVSGGHAGMDAGAGRSSDWVSLEVPFCTG
jgi:hypothetical protein